MKVLIAGAGGQLGRELGGYLPRHGVEVAAASRTELDILDSAAVAAALDRHRPDWVINCAAYTQVDRAESEPDRAFAVNRDGAARLAHAAQASGIRLLQMSTDYVFDGRRHEPYDEEAPCNPLNQYGQSKLAGEQAVRLANPDALVLRTSWVYGVHGRNFVKSILAQARERDVLRVVADQVGTPTWTRDLARVIHRLLGDGAGGIFHYSAAGAASWYDFACAIVTQSRALGVELRAGTIEPVSSAAHGAPARRPAYSVLDKRKIRARFADLSIPDWRDSLTSMLKELNAC